MKVDHLRLSAELTGCGGSSRRVPPVPTKVYSPVHAKPCRKGAKSTSWFIDALECDALIHGSFYFGARGHCRCAISLSSPWRIMTWPARGKPCWGSVGKPRMLV